MKKLLLLLTFAFLASFTLFGVTLIDPAGDGGFENGTTFPDNGWTLVNHTLNNWYIGPLGANAGTNGAYISNDSGVTNAYTTGTAQTSHFYRDVTIPDGEVGLLAFNWKGQGESTYDRLLVYIAPQTVTPVAGTPVSSSTTLTGATLLGMYNLQSAWQSATLSLVGWTGAIRLIFTWQNDTSLGTMPPTNIDNISLTTYTPTPLTGIKIIGTVEPYDYLTFTAAINGLNQNGVGTGGVTFQVQDGTYAENPPAITVGGTAANPVVFQPVTGANPVLTPTGGSGTFGFKVEGGDYITFNGIDISNPDGTLVYGYWFINGTDYITVQNSVITMPYVATSNYAIRSYGTNNNCSFLNNTIPSNTYYGIYVYGVSGAEAQNNLVQGNVLSGIRNYGIYNYYAYNTVISYNTVACMAANTNAFYGIYNASSTTSADIHHNEVSGGSSSSAIYPIYVTAGATLNIYANKVHNFEYTGTSTSIVYGIYISGGTTVNTYNNMVYDLRSPAGTSAPQIRAIAIGGGTTQNLWNNSVYLNATSSAASFATAALYISSTTPTVDLRNNIFVNKSVPGSTGRSVALWKTSAGVSTFAATTDKNIYYAGVPDATHLIGYFSSTSYQTLAAYQAMALTKDQGSYSEDVPFVSGTRIIDLHIDPLVTTRVEGNALPIQPPVNFDIDGDPRDASTPDIGADEGEFTPVGGAPGLVTLLTPADGALAQDPNTLTLTWSAPTSGGTPLQYYVFIAESETEFWDTQIFYAEVDVPSTSLNLSTVTGLDLAPETTYYWAVQAHNGEGDSDPDDPGFMIFEFTTMQRMTAPADLPLGNVWPETTETGVIPVVNHGPVELTFDASGPDEFEFGITRFTVPRNSSYDLPYTFTVPATLGAYTGTIVLQQTNPDPLAAPLNIPVTANVTTDVIVGTGTTDLDLPVNVFYGYTYSQTIYYPSELNYPAGYRIEKLYYYFNGYETCETTKDYVIWMGHTPNTTFATTTSWIPLASLTQVYAGENIPQLQAGGYWMEFVLNAPFIYDGVSNLVIAVDENFPGYDASSAYFLCTSASGNRSLRYYSDSTNPDPTAPPTGTQIAGYPNTKFLVAPIPTTPQITVNPEAKDFGSVIINTEHVQQFSVSNNGAGTLSIASITYAGDPYFQLQNLPAEFPVNLTITDPPATFQVKYLPTVAGTHSGTVTITDNRGITTIDLDGVCVDPRIASLPHSQNFDGVTAPAFPLGWTPYKSYSSSTLVTSTSYAQSNPNSVYMYANTTTETMRLISPQVLVPMNSFKLSFYLRAGGTGYTMKVGTVSALDGSGVFNELASITPATSGVFTQYTVSFLNNTSTDQYICFQHGVTSTYQSFYLDSVLLEELLPIDMAATAISGPGLGTVGEPMSFDITVYNNGTATQNSYTVHLKKHGDDRLASLPVDTPLDPGMYATHTITWTPTALDAGSLNLVGEVERTGDGNAANNETTPKAVVILPAGAYIPLVGDPLSTTTANTLPLNFYWKNSVSETIYTALEMQMSSGDINGLAYFNNFTQNLAGKPVKIWAKNTTATDLSAGWLPFTDYVLVFDGVLDFPIASNTIVIPFIAPFPYTGGNLALRVNRPLDTVYFNSTNTFYYTVPQHGTSRSYELHSDSDTIDPTNPVQGTSTYGGVTDNIPVTAFLATNAVPVVLAAPVVSLPTLVNGTDLSITWSEVPGAYAYRIYGSPVPLDPDAVWPEPPIAVVWAPSFTYSMLAGPMQFFKVVAVSSYRGYAPTFGTNPFAWIEPSTGRERYENPVGRTDNKD